MERIDYSKKTAKLIAEGRRKAKADQAFWQQQRRRDRVWIPRIEHQDRERNKR